MTYCVSGQTDLCAIFLNCTFLKILTPCTMMRVIQLEYIFRLPREASRKNWLSEMAKPKSPWTSTAWSTISMPKVCTLLVLSPLSTKKDFCVSRLFQDKIKRTMKRFFFWSKADSYIKESTMYNFHNSTDIFWQIL